MGKLGKKFYKRTYTKKIRGLVLFREKNLSMWPAVCRPLWLISVPVVLSPASQVLSVSKQLHGVYIEKKFRIRCVYSARLFSGKFK